VTPGQSIGAVTAGVLADHASSATTMSLLAAAALCTTVFIRPGLHRSALEAPQSR